MGRRANGRGTISKRGNSYRGQQTINGKRKSYTAKTKKDVEDQMERDRVDFLRGNYINTTGITLNEWARSWLKKKESTVKPQTYVKIASYFNNHILPELGQYKLNKIKGIMIEEMYQKICRRDDGTAYSNSHIRQMAAYFKSCLEKAVACELLVRNPHSFVDLPKGSSTKDVEAYTVDEQQKIVAYISKSEKRSDWLFYIMLSTGMREGEAEALGWDDVNLASQTIHIHKTRLLDATIQEEPKTKKSNRIICVGKSTIKALNYLKRSINQDENVRNLVVPNTKYNSYAPDYLRRRFAKICAELNIPYHNGIHCLRHTWATRALEKGINIKVVSEMLGHENVAITMNIYQSVLKDLQQDVAEQMDNVVEF